MSAPTPDDLEQQALSTAEWLWQQILRAFDLVRAGLGLSALERWLLARNVEAAVRSVGLDRLTMALQRLATGVLGPIRAAGWEGALHGLPPEILRVALGQPLGEATRLSYRLQQAINRADLSRIQGITTETEDALRAIIRSGLEAGTTPATLARAIQAQIGLNTRQAQAVINYRALLERQARDPEQIDRMVGRYTTKQLRMRAQTIARTELLRAQNEGRRLQWQHLVDTGTLRADEWEVEWIGSHLESECPLCWDVDGQRTGIGGTFDTDLGPVTGPPLHPNCSCYARLVLRGFRRGEPIAPARDAILAKLGRLG